MSTMMESIALNDESSHIVEEESEYVLVEDDMDVDERDEEYDYCDDAFRTNSPFPSSSSSSFSLCSNSVSFDNIDAALEETESSTIVSLDVDIDDISLGKLEEEIELAAVHTGTEEIKPTEQALLSQTPMVVRMQRIPTQSRPSSRGSSRLSNKKRRKKMKLMKKAAAATAAAAAIAAGAASPSRSARIVPNKPKNHHSKKAATTRSSKKKVSNVAVACATASLQQFRRDHSVMM